LRINFFKNIGLKKFFIVLALITTLLVSLWPDFHPERQINIAYSLPLDMLFHSGYYFFLSILLRYVKFIPVKSVLFFLIFFCISTFLEMLQAWVPKRSVSLLDLFSNLLGITLGLLFYEVVWVKFGNRTTKLERKNNRNQKNE
jgi:VanZ family protein